MIPETHSPETSKTQKGLLVFLIGHLLVLFVIILPWIVFAVLEALDSSESTSSVELVFLSVFCCLGLVLALISFTGRFMFYKGKDEFSDNHSRFVIYSTWLAVIGFVAFAPVFFSLLLLPTVSMVDFELGVFLTFALLLPVFKASRNLQIYHLVTVNWRYLLHGSLILNVVLTIWIAVPILSGGYFLTGFDSLPFMVILLILAMGSFSSHVVVHYVAYSWVRKGILKPRLTAPEEPEFSYRPPAPPRETAPALPHEHRSAREPPQRKDEWSYAYRLRSERMGRNWAAGGKGIVTRKRGDEEPPPRKTPPDPPGPRKETTGSSSSLMKYWEDDD